MSTYLDIEFQKAYKKISSLSQENFAPDVMLKIYAYYKQATYGDNNPEFRNDEDELDLKNRFKLNAWIQLRGMPVNDAKKEYIKIVNSISIQNKS